MAPKLVFWLHLLMLKACFLLSFMLFISSPSSKVEDQLVELKPAIGRCLLHSMLDPIWTEILTQKAFTSSFASYSSRGTGFFTCGEQQQAQTIIRVPSQGCWLGHI